DDVEEADRSHVSGIKHGALFDGPAGIDAEEALPQLGRAGDALAIEIERMHAAAQSSSCQAENAAAASDVEKSSSLQLFLPELRGERHLRLPNTLGIEHRQKSLPVPAELEAFAPGDFLFISAGSGPQFETVSNHRVPLGTARLATRVPTLASS